MMAPVMAFGVLFRCYYLSKSVLLSLTLGIATASIIYGFGFWLFVKFFPGTNEICDEDKAEHEESNLN